MVWGYWFGLVFLIMENFVLGLFYLMERLLFLIECDVLLLGYVYDKGKDKIKNDE